MDAEDIHLFTHAYYEVCYSQDHVSNTDINYIYNDIQREPILPNWKSIAIKYDIQSCMVVFIKKLGNAIGTLNLYSTELNFFDHAEIKLLVEAASDISFALDLFEQVKRQKESDQLIFKSENRFRVIIEKSSELITLSTKEGKLLYISPSISKALGYSFEELNQVSGFDFMHPDDFPEFVKKDKQY